MIPKKPFLFVILFSLIFLSGCSNPIEESIKVEKEEIQNLSDDLVAFADQFKLSIVLSKEGCTGCNKKIMKIIEDNVSKSDFGIIVETTGKNYDISSILVDDLSDRVIKDYKSQLSKKLNVKDSFFIYYPSGLKGDGAEFHTITVKNMDTFEELLKMYLAK